MFLTTDPNLAETSTLNADHSLQSGIEFAKVATDHGDPGGAYQDLFFQTQAAINAGPFSRAVCSIGPTEVWAVRRVLMVSMMCTILVGLWIWILGRRGRITVFALIRIWRRSPFD